GGSSGRDGRLRLRGQRRGVIPGSRRGKGVSVHVRVEDPTRTMTGRRSAHPVTVPDYHPLPVWSVSKECGWAMCHPRCYTRQRHSLQIESDSIFAPRIAGGQQSLSSSTSANLPFGASL